MNTRPELEEKVLSILRKYGKSNDCTFTAEEAEEIASNFFYLQLNTHPKSVGKDFYDLAEYRNKQFDQLSELLKKLVKLFNRSKYPGWGIENELAIQLKRNGLTHDDLNKVLGVLYDVAETQRAPSSKPGKQGKWKSIHAVFIIRASGVFGNRLSNRQASCALQEIMLLVEADKSYRSIYQIVLSHKKNLYKI